MPDRNDLMQRRALPLGAKVLMTKARIREWYNHFEGQVYVSFSGGKDSTVLAHLVREMYPEVPLVFSNTGLEFPEIQAFAHKMGAEFLRPKMQFSEVISKYGYPIISKEVAYAIYYARAIHKNKDWQTLKRGVRNKLLAKTSQTIFNYDKWLPICNETRFMISHYCCSAMKKEPIKKFEKENKIYPYIGTLTEESKVREMWWFKRGCNAYEGAKISSQPLSFWTEQDVLHYIRDNGIEIASVYGNIVATDKSGFEYEPLPGIECQLKCSGCQRTGCIFCGFGCYLEKGETRFQRLAKTHPKQYEYCMMGGQWVDNPAYDPTAPEYDGAWKNWNPKKIWTPSKKGLGMKKVFDDCNAIYGKDFIKYE